MDGESWLIILLIIGAAVGLIAFFAKKRAKTAPPTRPAVTTTMKTASPVVRTAPGRTASGTPVVRYPQNTPQPDPVIPIFEDRIVRQIRRCTSCDGENAIHATICEICGRRL